MTSQANTARLGFTPLMGHLEVVAVAEVVEVLLVVETLAFEVAVAVVLETLLAVEGVGVTDGVDEEVAVVLDGGPDAASLFDPEPGVHAAVTTTT